MPALAGLDISPAVALEALYTRVCSAVRAATGTGALTLPGLDAACRQLLAASPLPDLPGPDADLSVDALYLATEIYPAGGHRMLLEQLIRSRPADTHKVVFTGLLNNTPAFGQARMADFGVPVFAPDPVAILWDKWMALRAHIAHCAPARIFLLHHSEDVIAALLAYEFSDIYKERLIFVRHADTVPSLGADLGNATHMAIRPAQAEVLLARWPALKLHHVPLCFDPATPLPRMVAETPVALTRGQLGMSRRQRLRNMAYQALRHTVWKSRRARFAALQYRARRQPVPPRSHTPLITATCGTEHKFERSGPFALPDIIVHVLRSGARGHIHVGPASPALRHACRDALRRAGLPSRRLQFTGEVPSVADALRAHRVTLFLGSFPVGGALSRAEAAWAGIPIALQQVQTGSSPYLVGADFAPEAVLAWHGPEDLAEQIAGWSPALFDRLSTSARRWFDQSLSPAAFAAAVTELVDALPREVARPHGAASSVENGPLITAQGVTEWVTQRLRVVHTGADAQVAHPARQVTIQRPRVVARTHIAPSVQNWDLPTIETHIWPNAIVVGGADGIVTQDGTWYDPGLKDLNPDQISLRNPGPVRSMENDHAEVRRGVQTGLIPEAIQGTGCYSHNYYHFMHEVLPRIWTAAHRAPFGTPVLTEDDLPAQCVQALRMILPHNTIEMVRRGQSVQVNRLYTSGMGTIANELKIPDSAPPIAALRYHPDLLTRLGKLGCIAQGGQAPTHLFLWRSSKVRVLRNRTRLRDRLEEQGFAIVDTASMGFANQIRMMGQAECIVAQSGAHLTNIAFAPKGCRIIPLFSDAPDINYRLWSAMGQMLGLDVVNVAGTKNAEEQGIHADFTVSPDLVLPLVGVKTSDVPSSASALLTGLRDFSFEADVLTGAWAVLAGDTPCGFAGRVVGYRRAARVALEGEVKGAKGLLAHEFFADYGRNLRSGFTAFADLDAAEVAAAARVREMLCDLAESGSDTADLDADEQRCLLMRGMLLLPNWQVPLPQEPQRLPEDVLERWVHWASLPPFLGRAGEDLAWVAHVARLLDWIADGLDATQSADLDARDAALRRRLLRLLSGLDLGQLLLVDAPLNAVQRARNRVLEHVALRSGTPRSAVRALPVKGVDFPVSEPQKQRIGILCRTFEKGPDSEAVVAFFRRFDPAHYEIYAYSVGFRDRVASRDPEFDTRFDNAITHRRELPGDPSGIRSQILADDLDVFLYANATTYGIQPMDIALYHRVAPVQAVLNSHVPMAMGYPSFDAVITGLSDDPAQEVAQEQHSETLIRVPGPVISYLTSFEPRKTPALSRADLGLLDTDIVMMNAGSSMKLRHESLRAMMRSVVDVPHAKLLLAPYNPGWAARSLAFAFNVQVAEVAAEVGLDPARIVILGELSVTEAEAALSCADIYLNPFPHGGATMTHLALIYGVPPVTLRRGSTRSIDQFLVSALGFEELLASDVEAYVALAQRLARDTALRTDTATRLKQAARNPVFVDSPQHSKAMQKALEHLVRNA